MLITGNWLFFPCSCPREKKIQNEMHKEQVHALASMAQLVGASSHNRKAAGSIPSQGAYLGCGLDPGPGACGRQPVNAFFSH